MSSEVKAPLGRKRQASFAFHEPSASPKRKKARIDPNNKTNDVKDELDAQSTGEAPSEGEREEDDLKSALEKIIRHTEYELQFQKFIPFSLRL